MTMRATKANRPNGMIRVPRLFLNRPMLDFTPLMYHLNLTTFFPTKTSVATTATPRPNAWFAGPP